MDGAVNDFQMDDSAVFEMLNSADGPVGRMLSQLTDQIVTVARAKVRVRIPGSDRTGITSDARAPGTTLASIHTRLGWRGDGTIYGSGNADADPAIFLEKPAEQDKREYPFLTTGLDSLWGVF